MNLREIALRAGLTIDDVLREVNKIKGAAKGAAAAEAVKQTPSNVMKGIERGAAKLAGARPSTSRVGTQLANKGAQAREGLKAGLEAAKQNPRGAAALGAGAAGAVAGGALAADAVTTSDEEIQKALERLAAEGKLDDVTRRIQRSFSGV